MDGTCGLMAYTPKRLVQTRPASTAETTIFTATAKTIIKEILIAGTVTYDQTISMSLVPSGGAAGVANRIFRDMVIIGSVGPIVIPLATVMAVGDFLSVQVSDSNSLVLTISGVEFT